MKQQKRTKEKTGKNNISRQEPEKTKKRTGAGKKGYMDSHGRPRQPRQTQENKAGTLRYEYETETWHCEKCGKQYSEQNARSAKSHATEHMKQAAKLKVAKEQALK